MPVVPLPGSGPPGAVGQPTVVPTVALLLARFGSDDDVVTLATFVTVVVPGFRLYVAETDFPLPLAMVPSEQGKTAQAPATETSVVPAGVGSLSWTFAAGDGPLLMTLIAYVIWLPAVSSCGPTFVKLRSAVAVPVTFVVEGVLLTGAR